MSIPSPITQAIVTDEHSVADKPKEAQSLPIWAFRHRFKLSVTDNLSLPLSMSIQLPITQAIVTNEHSVADKPKETQPSPIWAFRRRFELSVADNLSLSSPMSIPSPISQKKPNHRRFEHSITVEILFFLLNFWFVSLFYGFRSLISSGFWRSFLAFFLIDFIWVLLDFGFGLGGLILTSLF